MFEIKTRGGKVLLDEGTLTSNVTGLTKEQIESLSTLVKNVFGEKIQDIHSGYDETFMNKLGLPAKPTDKKSYEHWADEALKLKNSSDTVKTELEGKINSHLEEISGLKKKIEEGKGGEALKTEIENLRKESTEKDKTIEELRGDNELVVNEWKSKYEKEVEANHNSKVVNLMSLEEAKIARKKGVSDVDAKSVIGAARARILEKYGVHVDGETLEFKIGETTHRNPNNARNAYTYSELLSEELKGSSLFDFEKKGGGGTAPPIGGGSSHGVVIGEVKTKRDFTIQLTEQLRKNGIPQGSDKAKEITKELREEYSVDELPLA